MTLKSKRWSEFSQPTPFCWLLRTPSRPFPKPLPEPSGHEPQPAPPFRNPGMIRFPSNQHTLRKVSTVPSFPAKRVVFAAIPQQRNTQPPVLLIQRMLHGTTRLPKTALGKGATGLPSAPKSSSGEVAFETGRTGASSAPRALRSWKGMHRKGMDHPKKPQGMGNGG